jgi:uncharacterized protein
MRKLPFIVAALFAVFALAALGPARAQGVSPQQIQGQIAGGQAQAALAELQPVLQAHPDSAVAWYLSAEAQDASGNETAAASALANAEHYAPGLPFARPDAVAALQSRIAGASAAGPVAHRSGISPMLVGIIGMVILFLALRMFFRPRRFVTPSGYPAGYGPAPGAYPYGPNAGPGGMGGGLGGALLGGLAAGAGFAAGERVIGDMFGGNNGNFQQDQNFGNGGSADDGLIGNPGWDNSSGGQDNNFDPGNNW